MPVKFVVPRYGSAATPSGHRTAWEHLSESLSQLDPAAEARGRLCASLFCGGPERNPTSRSLDAMQASWGRRLERDHVEITMEIVERLVFDWLGTLPVGPRGWQFRRLQRSPNEATQQALQILTVLEPRCVKRPRGGQRKARLDILLLYLWCLFEDLGGTPSACFNNRNGNRVTLFSRGAHKFIRGFPKEMFGYGNAPTLKAISSRAQCVAREFGLTKQHKLPVARKALDRTCGKQQRERGDHAHFRQGAGAAEQGH